MGGLSLPLLSLPPMSTSARRADKARDAFVSECANSSLISQQFPTMVARCKMCEAQYDRSMKRRGRASWAEVAADIAREGVVISEEEARIILPGVPREQYEQGKTPPFTGMPAGKMGPDSSDKPTVTSSQTP